MRSCNEETAILDIDADRPHNQTIEAIVSYTTIHGLNHICEYSYT